MLLACFTVVIYRLVNTTSSDCVYLRRDGRDGEYIVASLLALRVILLVSMIK